MSDRSSWGPGPWDDEPDAVSWVSAVGLLCELRRGGLGIWCGYVGARPDHPVWRLDVESALDVHGGISLQQLSEEFPQERAMPPGLKWAGFDAGHAFDMMPEIARSFRSPTPPVFGTYRDVVYMKTQCELLAVQIDTVALIDEAGFDVTAAPEWAIEYARRFHVPRADRLAMLRRLAADPVAAQLAETMGIQG